MSGNMSHTVPMTGLKFNEILFTEGDTFSRYIARIDEMWESMNIIEQLIDNIPEGPFAVKMKPVIKLPEGEYYQRVETARGELGCIYYK